MKKVLLGIFILFLVACAPFVNDRVTDGKLAGATYTDPKTGLMWAGQVSEKDLTWEEAKVYCVNYRGGGYTNWRVPTKAEVAELFASGADKNIKIIGLFVWASESGGSTSANYTSYPGNRYWSQQMSGSPYRALPVRSVK